MKLLIPKDLDEANLVVKELVGQDSHESVVTEFNKRWRRQGEEAQYRYDLGLVVTRVRLSKDHPGCINATMFINTFQGEDRRRVAEITCTVWAHFAKTRADHHKVLSDFQLRVYTMLVFLGYGPHGLEEALREKFHLGKADEPSSSSDVNPK